MQRISCLCCAYIFSFAWFGHYLKMLLYVCSQLRCRLWHIRQANQWMKFLLSYGSVNRATESIGLTHQMVSSGWRSLDTSFSIHIQLCIIPKSLVSIHVHLKQSCWRAFDFNFSNFKSSRAWKLSCTRASLDQITRSAYSTAAAWIVTKLIDPLINIVSYNRL